MGKCVRNRPCGFRHIQGRVVSAVTHVWLSGSQHFGFLLYKKPRAVILQMTLAVVVLHDIMFSEDCATPMGRQ